MAQAEYIGLLLVPKMDLISLATGKKFEEHYAKLHRQNVENLSIDHRSFDPSISKTSSDELDKEQWFLDVMQINKSDNVIEEKMHEKENKDYLVTWDGPQDALNPKNWSNMNKWWIIIQICIITMPVTFSSSVYSTGISEVVKVFHASIPVASLGTCTYLVGFSMGSLPFAPLSGIYGRFIVYLITLIVFTLLQIGGGVAQNVWTLAIIRYFQGFFGSTPLANCGGTVSDIYSPVEYTFTVPILCAFPFLGPVIGPIIGDFISQSYLGWRWTFWITMIFSGSVALLVIFTLPETHADTILYYKARYLRKVTGNPLWYTENEKQRDPKRAIVRAFTNSISLLISEPIVVCFTIYVTILFAIVYINFESYPIVYSQYGFNQGEQGLSFIGIGIGILLATSSTPIIYYYYSKNYKKMNGNVPPEYRLYPLFIGCFLLPIGLFWFAWTCYPHKIHWIVPLISSIFFGASLLLIFSVMFTYFIDTYRSLAPSALAAATLVRYSASGGMTLVARPMYHNLGDHWATTLLGFISAAMIPIPFVFFRYGKTIRSHSKYAYKG
ncbi:MFS transporter [Schizosaccharomyces cryophilus OY26]|uniref:MFS transporter n=1 Tax=Schizosaccharomyces cryophilus (strain OY26 / ATCC MYA-4695 / CBS 11777 / NBRC 106824 / NRRL Y48691) TaxID=653667 RepID=S9VT60_SCHCR|nr:MFS transporter [Schizosaccharomyces cryophilus OY26]EPY51058.1 MFS transporter [Schizosaccharomyces cryophilus OY26]